MGFFDEVGKVSLAGNLFGGGDAAESTIKASENAAQVQREAFDQAQANLQPFLDVSLAQIPGLEEGATGQGFMSRLLDVRGSIPDIFSGVTDARGQAGQAASASAGLNLTPQAMQEISQLPPDIQNALVFDIEQELNRREQELFAPGTTTGTELSRLGADSAAGIGNTLTQGLFDAQQARAAGQQNLLSIASGIGGVMSGRPQSQPVGFVDHAAGFQGPQPAR